MLQKSFRGLSAATAMGTSTAPCVHPPEINPACVNLIATKQVSLASSSLSAEWNTRDILKTRQLIHLIEFQALLEWPTPNSVDWSFWTVSA